MDAEDSNAEHVISEPGAKGAAEPEPPKELDLDEDHAVGKDRVEKP